jgi:lysophospholipase L1-like esterase
MSFVSFNRFLFLGLIGAMLLVPARSGWAQDNLGYFMPIGDSITEGFDATGNEGGWRTPLYTDLTNAGYGFTYEGDHNTFSPVTFAGTSYANAPDSSALLIANGESYSNGWSGATMVNEGNGSYSIYDSLPAWLASPDLIPSPGSSVLPSFATLEIGTNDILQGVSNVTTLLNDLNSDITEFVSLDPTAHLIVAQITPLTGGDSGYNSTVIAFNAGIPALVAAHDALGQHVSVVNLYNSISLDGSEQYDGVHPNIAGNAAIATDYLNAIEAIDPVPEPSVLALFIPGAALLIVLRRRLGQCA